MEVNELKEDRNCLAGITDDAGNLLTQALNCFTEGVGGICERRFNSEKRHCEYGWFLYEGKCLHAEAFRGTYEQSKKYCEAMGGILAAPQDEGLYVWSCFCHLSFLSIRTELFCRK